MSDGRRKPSSTFHLLAGLGSGFTSSILLQPFDLLKTRLQQQSRSGPSSASSLSPATPATLVSTVRTILSQPRPVRTLWRGTLPSTIRTSFGSALYFTALNKLRTELSRFERFTTPSRASAAGAASSSSLVTLTAPANLCAGAVARASVGFLMMPVTVLKVRYESSLYSYRSLRAAAADIWTHERRLRGFFAGAGATAIRDAPYAGLYVVFYEQGKRALGGLAAARTAPGGGSAGGGDGRLGGVASASINMASSMLAAALATALTNPPDAIKTRLQVQPRKYRNTVQAAKMMLAEDGVRSFFDGLALRMARKALSSALAWTVYEEFVRRAGLAWAERGEDEARRAADAGR